MAYFTIAARTIAVLARSLVPSWPLALSLRSGSPLICEHVIPYFFSSYKGLTPPTDLPDPTGSLRRSDAVRLIRAQKCACVFVTFKSIAEIVLLCTLHSQYLVVIFAGRSVRISLSCNWATVRELVELCLNYLKENYKPSQNNLAFNRVNFTYVNSNYGLISCTLHIVSQACHCVKFTFPFERTYNNKH